MTRQVSEQAGLGSPPQSFTTNASESVNAVMKVKVDYKRSELLEFIEKIRALVMEQQIEIEMAVVNQGKYKLKQTYRSLGVCQSEFYKMTREQRSRLSKFNRFTVAGVPVSSENSDVDSKCLGMGSDEAAKGTTVSPTIMKTAAELINSGDSIAPAPCLSQQARNVHNRSSGGFHTVKPGKGGDTSASVLTASPWEYVLILLLLLV